VSDRGKRRRRRTRLVAGTIVGAALVAVQRRRGRRAHPPGLRAFESAPCFREQPAPESAPPDAESA